MLSCLIISVLFFEGEFSLHTDVQTKVVTKDYTIYLEIHFTAACKLAQKPQINKNAIEQRLQLSYVLQYFNILFSEGFISFFLTLKKEELA